MIQHLQQAPAPARRERKFFLTPLTEDDACLPLVRLNTFKQEYEIAYQQARDKMKIRTRLEISTDDLRDLGHSEGDKRLAEIRYLLNNLGPWKRSEDQIKFHNAFIIACLPHIYGKDWNANGARVLKELNITQIEYEVLCMTPRRFGKTMAVAMFVAVLALVCKGIKIAVFSTGSRASKSMVDHILKFVKYIPNGPARKIKHSKEELMFSASPLGIWGAPGSMMAKNAESMDDTSKIYSYPSSVDSKYYLLCVILNCMYTFFCYFVQGVILNTVPKQKHLIHMTGV
jgi:hypothetical protein